LESSPEFSDRLFEPDPHTALDEVLAHFRILLPTNLLRQSSLEIINEHELPRRE
jgi:hypothetical protein